MSDLTDAELALALNGECHTAEVVVWLAREVKRCRDAQRAFVVLPAGRVQLQTVLGQLSDLTPVELGEVKRTVVNELESQLRALGVNGDLTEEEWKRLEGNKLIDCVKMVRERTGLGLVDSKAYVDRARAKGRRSRAHTPAGDNIGTAHELAARPYLDDSGAGPQRSSADHTLYCPRGCCDTPVGQDFGNGGLPTGHRWSSRSGR